MNEKDAIIQKIISDAQDRAEKILSDANEKARLIWAEAQSKSEKALIDCEKESDIAEKELIERTKTLARLESRKILLGAKQKAVESAFENALSALLKAPDGEYVSYVVTRAKKYAKQGDLLILSASAPDGVTSEIKKFAAENSLNVKKTGDFKGGVIISGDKTDYDFTFEAAVKSYADERSGEVARELFKEND